MSDETTVLATSIAQIVLMTLLPIVVAIVVARRSAPRWMLAIGAATFLGSQVVHLPLNHALTVLGAAAGLNEVLQPASALIVNALVLGFTAAFCEEGARFFVFRMAFARRPEWCTQEAGLTHGVGHGGVEAIALAMLVAITLIGMLSMRGVDVAQLPIPPDQRALAARQIEAFWSMPAWMPFVAVLERALTMILHVALSIVVAYGVATRRFRPVWLAFLTHWAVDAFAVLGIGGIPLIVGDPDTQLGVLIVEGALVAVAVGSIVVVRRSREWSFAPVARPSASPSVASPSAASPSVASPSAASPSVASPSVASPSAASPSVASPSAASAHSNEGSQPPPR